MSIVTNGSSINRNRVPTTYVKCGIDTLAVFATPLSIMTKAVFGGDLR
jgi:hypothetical protein